MSEFSEVLKQRSKQYALRIIRLVENLPKSAVGDVIGNQLLRAGTSVAANYRAACRARSKAEFCAKMGIVEEEADESVFWMEMTVEAGLLNERKVLPLMNEGKEITAIVVSSINTARRSLSRSTAKRPNPT